ncbi:flagellar basal-body rod protein FlgC [alpha proteobacterium AAP81b]|nr:flagellar basal-body rod protein FlgC [alpha proteobacterium AAP81b]
MSDLFATTGRAMAAQLVRLNTIASNLANAGAVAGTEAGAYRALKPVFATAADGGVDVAAIARTGSPEKRLDPGHPLADAQGFIWQAAVDPNQELVEMVETARQYANDVEVLTAAKSLALDTLRLGR